MDRGLLWFDNNPKIALEEKIRQAAARYRQKFGQPANMCLVNPREGVGVEGGPRAEVVVDDARIRIAAVGYILPNHYLVGVATR